MELRAIMELGGGRGKSTGKKGTPYIVCGKDPTVTHQPARGQRYYRAWPAVLLQGRAVLLLAIKRYYRTAMRYYRTDPRCCRNPSDSKDKQTCRNWGRYFRKRGTTAPPMRYYRKAKRTPARGKETSVPTSAKKRK